MIKHLCYRVLLSLLIPLILATHAHAEIKNIIFDFGGVVLELEHARTAAAFKALGARDFETFYSQNRQNDVFELFEAGKLEPQKFRDFAKTQLGIESVSNQDF